IVAPAERVQVGARGRNRVQLEATLLKEGILSSEKRELGCGNSGDVEHPDPPPYPLAARGQLLPVSLQTRCTRQLISHQRPRDKPRIRVVSPVQQCSTASPCQISPWSLQRRAPAPGTQPIAVPPREWVNDGW